MRTEIVFAVLILLIIGAAARASEGGAVVPWEDGGPPSPPGGGRHSHVPSRLRRGLGRLEGRDNLFGRQIDIDLDAFEDGNARPPPHTGRERSQYLLGPSENEDGGDDGTKRNIFIQAKAAAWCEISKDCRTEVGRCGKYVCTCLALGLEQLQSHAGGDDCPEGVVFVPDCSSDPCLDHFSECLDGECVLGAFSADRDHLSPDIALGAETWVDVNAAEEDGTAKRLCDASDDCRVEVGRCGETACTCLTLGNGEPHTDDDCAEDDIAPKCIGNPCQGHFSDCLNGKCVLGAPGEDDEEEGPGTQRCLTVSCCAERSSSGREIASCCDGLIQRKWKPSKQKCGWDGKCKKFRCCKNRKLLAAADGKIFNSRKCCNKIQGYRWEGTRRTKGKCVCSSASCCERLRGWSPENGERKAKNCCLDASLSL